MFVSKNSTQVDFIVARREYKDDVEDDTGRKKMDDLVEDDGAVADNVEGNTIGEDADLGEG